MQIGRIAALMAITALAGCTSASPAPSSGARGASGGAAAVPGPGAAQEVARLVNAHRARRGCPALAWDDLAARAAQGHSDDMARRDYFSHTSPEGRGLGERLAAQGIRYRAAAENIAYGQPTAEAVVNGWLNSTGHRANIENCALTRQGVGISGTRWTHVFYTPLQ